MDTDTQLKENIRGQTGNKNLLKSIDIKTTGKVHIQVGFGTYVHIENLPLEVIAVDIYNAYAEIRCERNDI